MKAFKTIGLLGLAITIVLNLVAVFWFKRASADYFSDDWWAGWFPSYVLWVSFTLIGFASHSRRNLGASRPSGSWLMLLLLLTALVPSVCLLWFMNQAAHNERLAARQKLADAYRANLGLVQKELENYWAQATAALEADAGRLAPAALFAQVVRAGLAEAMVCFDAEGEVSYPGPAPAAQAEVPGADWTEAEKLEASEPATAAEAFGRLAAQATDSSLAARALQAQARCLVEAGRKDEAVAVLTGPLAAERVRQATDAQGRLVAPNADLMAAELLKAAAPERARGPLERLRQRVLDYADAGMSAPQRRFLMRELQRLSPDESVARLLAAEDLAARYVEAGLKASGETGLRATALPEVWQHACARGQVVALHQTEAAIARMRGGVSAQLLPEDVKVAFVPPGKEFERYFLSLPAGASLPGWRLALSPDGPRLFETAAEQRIGAYVWIGVLVFATVIVLAALALRLVRRQMALTQLRNDLVANVTHELKTPLASMRLLVETLLDSERLEEKTAREYLQLIAQENLRLSRLIDNFLTFSRMERNKYAFGFKELPAGAIVEGAVASVRERFNAPGCEFKTEVAVDLPAVMADADALVTAVVNLLDNAYKYSGDEKKIVLSAGAANGSVHFAVKDNGIGLSARDTKRVFKRFYQVDQRLSRSGGGCGLGLSIVKFIVGAHHGSVRVESQPGRGSTFVISIPATVGGAAQRVKPQTDDLP